MSVTPAETHTRVSISTVRSTETSAASLSSVDAKMMLQLKSILEKKNQARIMVLVKMMIVVMLPLFGLVILAVLLLRDVYIGQDEARVAMQGLFSVAKWQELISCLQLERSKSVWFSVANDHQMLADFPQIFEKTDEAILAIPSWPSFLMFRDANISSVANFRVYLNKIRDLTRNSYCNVTEIYSQRTYDVFNGYANITAGLLDHLKELIEIPNISDIWKFPIGFITIQRAIDLFGMIRALGIIFHTTCYLSLDGFVSYLRSLGASKLALRLVFSYVPDAYPEYMSKYVGSVLEENITSNQEIIINNYQFYSECNQSTKADRLRKSDEYQIEYVKMADILMDIRIKIVAKIEDILEKYAKDTQTKSNAYTSMVIIAVSVSCILCIWFSVQMNSLLIKIAQFASAVRLKSKQLSVEKMRANTLLYQMLPKEVVVQLMSQQEVLAREYKEVTIYFSDIVGFTVLSSKSSPMQIVNMLNLLYSGFDNNIEKFDVYKVETIGDAYMVAGGVPHVIQDHAAQVALLALCLRSFVSDFVIPHLPDENMMLRIGLHSGSVVAGVVGQKMPRYCLFGDTVNTASRMESHGMAKKIHISNSTKIFLENNSVFQITERGLTSIKGKGEMMTYWLDGIYENASKSIENQFKQ